MAIKQIYHVTSLTGGVDSTYLDYADGNSLSDKDRAFAIVSGLLYLYELNATSGAAESSPNVIAPDTNAGTKRWILVSAYTLQIAASIVDGDLTHAPDGNSVFDALALKAPLASPVFTTQITTPIVYGGAAANGDITIEGTSHATKTTSYVILQPTSGNVGIGTTGPGAKLDVNGDIRSNTALSVVKAGSDTVAGGGPYLQLTDNSNWQIMQLGASGNLDFWTFDSSWGRKMSLTKTGNVGIGTTTPNYKLEIGTDSAGKPGVGGLWTVVSDERIKKDIEPADLARCYDIIKSIPLKYFGWADGVYTEDQVKDRHNLGWIAQDVQKVFSKAVNVVPFTKSEKIFDGEEEYEEQDFTVDTIQKEEVVIEMRDGKPVQVKKIVKSENKVMLFDEIEVVDEAGTIVMDEGTVLTYKVPRMVKKIRSKFRQDVIEDCLDLNSGQLYAAMYGALQACMQKIEALEARLNG